MSLPPALTPKGWRAPAVAREVERVLRAYADLLREWADQAETWVELGALLPPTLHAAVAELANAHTRAAEKPCRETFMALALAHLRFGGELRRAARVLPE